MGGNWVIEGPLKTMMELCTHSLSLFQFSNKNIIYIIHIYINHEITMKKLHLFPNKVLMTKIPEGSLLVGFTDKNNLRQKVFIQANDFRGLHHGCLAPNMLGQNIMVAGSRESRRKSNFRNIQKRAYPKALLPPSSQP